MHRCIFYAWFLILAIVVGACQKDSVSPNSEEPVLRELSVPEAELVTTINTFAFDLIRDLAEHRPQDNVFLSPYSINLALSMTLNGAASTTFTNLLDGLEHDVIAPREINKAYSELTPFLQQLDRQVDFTLATALWYDRRLRTQPLSEDLLSAYYQAHVGELAFGRRKSPGIINKWVSEQTDGQIDALVDELDPDASVYVTSAVQFVGDWSVPFRKEDTAPGFFYLPDGSKITTDMMVAPQAQYRFFQDETKTIIDIPYGNRQYSMTLLMSRKQDSLLSLVDELDANSFRNYLAQMDTVSSTLYLPRFTIDYQASLKPTLSRLGMGVAFGDSANFNRLFTDATASVPLSDVLHKAVINVNEVGTAATTSTVTQAKRGTAASTSLHVDRSFLFFIRESHSGVIVFAGRLNHPTLPKNF
ncbi:MAG: serpin family protein [Tunicatimonas sp.]